MLSNKSDCTDCKKVFQKAYENRYTWPDNFNGYKGKCFFKEDKASYDGSFKISKNFQPQIKDLEDKEIIKKISTQLFEVVIHRVKKSFDEIHSKNVFHFIRKSEKGIEMQISGKNEGDKYCVKDGKINMVLRKIHGIIIEIFVEDFFDTGDGVLSCKYSSQQLDVKTLLPKSLKYKYQDNFLKIQNTNLWVLQSREIICNNKDEENLIHQYIFKDIEAL
tara:strand:+ start:463 stop:1119 length:657 start_codon:yes stop_codon:yes gene_type:complete